MDKIERINNGQNGQNWKVWQIVNIRQNRQHFLKLNNIKIEKIGRNCKIMEKSDIIGQKWKSTKMDKKKKKSTKSDILDNI